MKRKKIITVALITLVAICLITTGISAANLIGADSVQYKDTTVKAALDDLMDKANNLKDMSLLPKVKVGDYVKMIPTTTSYSIPTNLTGYSDKQTIYPSELKLWRVISLNEDGTIDMVSEYVSSTDVYFSGTTGYFKLVGALNTIAKQYENSEFTVGSRYMGYNGQTEYITDTSKFTTTAPWTYNTKDNSNEAQGGGDILYQKDCNLVNNVFGTVVANEVGTTTATPYWLASRGYSYSSASYYGWGGWSVFDQYKRDASPLAYSNGSFILSNSFKRALRPIVTLKSSVQAVGSGTDSDPWILF